MKFIEKENIDYRYQRIETEILLLKEFRDSKRECENSWNVESTFNNLEF